MENKLRHIISTIITEELNEMAAIPKLLKIGDATKLEQAKRLYDDETFWVRKMIDAVEAAGETGVPRMLYKEKGNEGRSIDGLTNIIDKGQQLVNPKVADFIDIGLFVEFGSVIPKKVKSTEVGKRGRPAKSTDGMVAVRNAMNSGEELEDMNDESFDPLVYDDDEDENSPLNESFTRKQKPLNKQLKLMKKQPLNEEFKRMQKLAGLNENNRREDWTNPKEWEGACERYFEEYGLFDLKAFEREVYDNGDAQNNLAFEIAKEAGFEGNLDNLINNNKFNIYCNYLAKYFLLLYGDIVYVVDENDPKYKEELDNVTLWLKNHKNDATFDRAAF